MPVAVQGYTQAVYWSSGQGTIAWPGGTAVGMICYLGCAGRTSSTPKKQPQNTAGWNLAKTTPSTKSWWKVLTAADIAAGLPCFGNVVFLVVLSGAGGIGNVTDQPGATMTSAIGGLIMFGRGKESLSSLNPATGKLGTDVENPAYDDRKNNVWFRAASAIGYLAVDGSFNGTDSDGFEVLPAAAPDPPLLSTPASGALLNAAVANTFTIVHQSSNPQTNLKLRTQEVGTSTWYYLQADGTLTTSEVDIPTNSASASLDAAQYTSGKTYEWTAATSDNGGSTFSNYQSVSTLTAVTAPTVNSITPTSPAEDLSPEVAFTMTANYGAQVAFQVRICRSADATSTNPLWDSYVVNGADLSISVPSSNAGIWTNGATLYAWVRVQQTGGLWSEWTKDNATFTVSWTPPTAPSSVTGADGLPMIVTVAGITAGYELLETQFSTDNKTTWQSLAIIVPDATSEVIPVAQSEYGVDTHFRARVMNVVSGVDLWSSWTESVNDVASTDLNSYLIDATNAVNYMQIRFAPKGMKRTEVRGIAMYYGLDDDRARVDRYPSQGDAGQFILRTQTKAEKLAIRAFLNTYDPIWVRWNPERDVTDGLHYSEPSTLISVISEFQLDPLVDIAVTDRDIPVSWVEQ